MDKLPLILEPEQLATLLEDENLLIVDLCSNEHYQAHHIPGAIHLPPAATQLGMPPAPGKLPTAERLQQIIQHIGLSNGKKVIVYDDEGGGWAGRFIWLLDCIGFNHTTNNEYAYLNGGLIAWANEGHPVTSEPSEAKSQGDFKIRQDYDKASIDISTVLEGLTEKKFNIWDARSPDEFNGLRSGSARPGRIPGAFNFEWTQAMDPGRHYRLKPLPILKDILKELGLDENKETITHCQTHHRSGLTYLIAKALNYPVRAYDGSWSEWGNREDTPVE